MRNNKGGFDEMQRERRGNVGNQMFMLMAYALLIDCGLYGFGVRWLNYPANVMVILMVCLGIYLVRLIASNAYFPSNAQTRKITIPLIIAIAGSALLAIVLINLFGESLPQATENSDDNSAVILLIVSAVGLIAAAIVAAIKRANSNYEEND